MHTEKAKHIDKFLSFKKKFFKKCYLKYEGSPKPGTERVIFSWTNMQAGWNCCK